MIPNVVKGGNVGGVLRYLAGPGRANEHVAPHLVAGSELAVAGYGDGVLTAGEAGELARWIDAPRIQHGVTMTVPVTEADPATGDRRVVGEKEQHVWHASLALPPGEGPLGDEKWQQVATEFADAMGLTGGDGKAPCRWVAIHHGPSKGGNDHVHLVASMVREDGTRWSPFRDYTRAQAACRNLEARHGLTAVDGPALGVSERGVKPAEARRATAAGLDPEIAGPRELAARLRAAALASTSEAEFVRRVRAEGIVLKPRYTPGSTTEVVGYKVAQRPVEGSREWQFHAGGKLGRDLSLPKLRDTWPTPDDTGTAAAVAEWRAAHTGVAAVQVDGRETRALAAGAERVAVERWRAFNEHLTRLPHEDTAGWAHASRDVAAALAAWRDPDTARAARILARAVPATTTGERGPGATAATVLLARTGRNGPAMGELGRELARSVDLIAGHHHAVGQTAEAARLAGTQLGRLVAVRNRTVGQINTAARAAERIVDHGR
ncbi:MAG: relaxase/mobilization nuclease domain-containing protein [Sporichthyaceae bacterium]